MYRFVAFTLVCIFAISSNAGEPTNSYQDEFSDIKRVLSDLNLRIAELESSIERQQEGNDVSIRFDQLRIPYSSGDARERVRSQISTKGRDAYFTGNFSTDAGWQRISVDDSCDIRSGVIRDAAISLTTGLMSEILDDGEALYILRVTKRTK